MAKVIKITPQYVYIAKNRAEVIKVKNEMYDFNVGDIVDIFHDGDEIILTLGKEQEKPFTQGLHWVEIEEEPVNEPNDRVYVQQRGKVVNQVIYVILAILLGSIGIQKFYAGKIFSGLLCILFSWTSIPFLIGLFDGITASLQRPDRNGNIVV